MTHIQLRRYLNQAVLSNKICNQIACDTMQAICSRVKVKPINYIPCHVWKYTKLVGFLQRRYS